MAPPCESMVVLATPSIATPSIVTRTLGAMADLEIPNFGALLAPYIGQVPPEATPRFLALLERSAAARYREWAEALPEHAELLLACSSSEDEIADRIDGAFPIDPSLADQLHAPLPDAIATYYDVFSAFDVWDQLRLQAKAERQGAQAWRRISGGVDDPAVLDALAQCSALEETSADRLDALIEAHAPRT